VILGIAPKLNLFHLFNEGMTLENILCDTPYGFRILPAASGVSDMVNLTTGQKLDLLESMDYLEGDIDHLIVDTGAGINDNVLYFNIAAQERLVVLTTEPTSLTDAYALIKVLRNNHGVDRFKILINMATDAKAAREVFMRLYAASDRFLEGVSLDLAGWLPLDPHVRQAVIRQVPFSVLFPDAPASGQLKEAARTIARWPAANRLDGNIKFFWKKILFHEHQREPLA